MITATCDKTGGVALGAIADAFVAMSRLNSFARLPRAWNLREVIYGLKRQAIKKADAMGLLTTRSVVVKTTCNKCTDGLWRSGQTCFRCKGAAKVDLYFQESTIGRSLACLDWPIADIRWHTPCRTAPEAEPITDWKPNQPGQELLDDELIRLLNQAEGIFSTSWDRFASYHINLGRAVDACAFCGTSATSGALENLSVSKGLLNWVAAVCKSCKGHYRVLGKDYGDRILFDRLPVPQATLTPDVSLWIDRRGGLSSVMKLEPDL